MNNIFTENKMVFIPFLITIKFCVIIQKIKKCYYLVVIFFILECCEFIVQNKNKIFQLIY